MAELVESTAKAAEVTEEDVAAAVAAELPKGKSLARVERSIARVLKGGATASGVIFLASLALELLPQTNACEVAIDALRKAGASLLLGTPVLRLIVSGVALGMRGEWRYAAYAAAVLGMHGLAVGAHYMG